MAVYNRYINASTGNNSNDGLTAGTAWATLQHGITNIPTGVAADIRILNLVGTFTLGSALTITDTDNMLMFKSTYSRDSNGYLSCGATINLNSLSGMASANRNHQSFDGIEITGIVTGNYGGGPINVANYGWWTNCIFRQLSGTENQYAWRSTATQPSLRSCELYGASEASKPLCSATRGSYIDCLFDKWRCGFGSIAATRCRFRNVTRPFLSEAPSPIGGMVSYCDHCSFWNCGNNPIAMSQYIEDYHTNNIIARSSGSGSVANTLHRPGNRWTNNALWNYVDTGTNDWDIPGRIYNYSPSTILTVTPYAVDPDTTNIWTPTEYIASLPSTDGATIGAVQLAGSSGGGGPAGFTGIRSIGMRLGK
jgi:hypothetical protein